VVTQEQTERVLGERTTWLERTLGRRGEGALLSAGVLLDASTGAMVAVHDTALVASTDFSRATMGRRQAGSSFKPMVYAMALDQIGADGLARFTTAHAVPNSPREFPGTHGWRPRNVAGRYSGTSSLANGLASSANIATASLLEQAGGPTALVDFAARMGFDTREMAPEMGLALGQGGVTPLEMARFVATITNGGRRVEGSPVLRAIDAAGQVRLAQAVPSEVVISPQAAALTRELMGLVVVNGTGGGVRGAAGLPGVQGVVIGKTGTTDDERDLWFVGAIPQYAAALWLGYDRPTKIGGSASDLSAPLWGWWMRAASEGLPPGAFDGPPLEHRWSCTQTGLLAGAGCRALSAPFVPGTEPSRFCGGTHGPELGESLADHESLWERRDREHAEAAAALPVDVPGPPPIDGAVAPPTL
jgi:penicillin-binding protein 1A